MSETEVSVGVELHGQHFISCDAPKMMHSLDKAVGIVQSRVDDLGTDMENHKKWRDDVWAAITNLRTRAEENKNLIQTGIANLELVGEKGRHDLLRKLIWVQVGLIVGTWVLINYVLPHVTGGKP